MPDPESFWVKGWVGAGAPFERVHSSPPGSSPPVGVSPTEAEARLPANLVAFLNGFKLNDAEKDPFYPSQIASLKGVGCPKLYVDFSHLLQAKENWDLAFDICNLQEMNGGSLKQAAIDFFVGNGLSVGTAEIVFTNLPRRIHRAKDFLASSARACSVAVGGVLTINVSTGHGRRMFDLILSKVLDYLQIGATWCGELSLDDMLILEHTDGHLELMIAKPPVIGKDASGTERASDLHSLWENMQPHYLLDGKLPLYFQELKDDLMTASAFQLKSDWFYEFLRFHPTLYSSTARSNFICRLQ
ncbi:hypothetical protein ACP4OV_030862 [Aristida adscensionis]